MRAVLEFPKIEEEKLELIKELIDNIAENIEEDCSEELNKLNSITGKEHKKLDFAEYWEWTDLDTMAQLALTPEPPCIRDLSETEMEEIVGIISDCLISGEENKAEYYIELLHKSLALVNVLDYVMAEDDTKKIVENMRKAASNSTIVL